MYAKKTDSKKVGRNLERALNNWLMLLKLSDKNKLYS